MLRFCDPGGRMYTSSGTSANILALWTTISFGGSITASGGRTTGSSIFMNQGDFFVKTLDAQATWGLACAVRLTSLGTQTRPIMGVRDAGTIQADVRVNTDGTLSVTRNGTVLATSTLSLSLNSYYHIELKTTINSTTGAYEVRVGGVTWIGPTTGANTRATANNSANQVFYGTPGFGGATNINNEYDDIVVWDAQATDANGFADIHDFIGDCGVAWLLPTGAGTTTQFTPLASTNFSQVNEAHPDGDTSYVEDATVGHIDTYATADLPAGVVTVKSLAVANYAKKTDVGSRGMKAEVRSGGGNTAHATESSLTNGYLYYLSAFGQDPNNGSATNWTPTSVNALEIGQTVSS